MSEKTKADKILEEMETMRNQYQKGQKDIATVLTRLQQKSDEFKDVQKPPHKHSPEVQFDCPDCQKEYDAQVSAKAVSDFKKKIKGMKQPTLCEGENCEEIYDAEEKEECPTCHRHGN